MRFRCHVLTHLALGLCALSTLLAMPAPTSAADRSSIRLHRLLREGICDISPPTTHKRLQ